MAKSARGRLRRFPAEPGLLVGGPALDGSRGVTGLPHVTPVAAGLSLGLPVQDTKLTLFRYSHATKYHNIIE